MSDPTAYDWASMLDKDDPTLSDLANAVDELNIPLRACREVLDKIGDGELDDPPEFAAARSVRPGLSFSDKAGGPEAMLRVPSLAIALVVLMDKVQSKRERLFHHLHRLAQSERTPEKPEAAPTSH